MTNNANPNAVESKGRISWGCKWEAAGIFLLGLLTVYFLKVSWRKWPDPIVDSGAQWYTFWRLSQREKLYHDLWWNYGPLSAFFNAGLFKVFGPGMMVLVAANLVVYALIATLAYTAFRRAWGWVAAFAATAVFISVFSFSHLSAVGNYNYATPYAHEATHGILLMLVTLLVASRWRCGASTMMAFWLGLCGGLAVVLKPEFILAGGVVGLAALALRVAEKKRVTLVEFVVLAAGLALPTLIFMAWFARLESLGDAFIDASRAWWMVIVDHTQLTQQQGKFTGLNNAGANLLFELKATGLALLSLATIWLAGWCANRPWKLGARMAVALAAAALLWFLKPIGGWYSIGRCFPILIAAAALLIIVRVVRELRGAGKLEEHTVMALLLVALAGAMLARMPLFPRIYHLGFFQAALAGMVLAAVIVAELPRWTGAGKWGRCVATAGALAMLATGCVAIALRSGTIRADQTQVVGVGPDRFYAFAPDIDATGALVNWTAEQLSGIPPQATVLVMPEGLIINFLSQHVSPVRTWTGGITGQEYLKQLQASSPDYVVLFSRETTEVGLDRFGAGGDQGPTIIKWVLASYNVEKGIGADPLTAKQERGVLILKRK